MRDITNKTFRPKEHHEVSLTKYYEKLLSGRLGHQAQKRAYSL